MAKKLSTKAKKKASPALPFKASRKEGDEPHRSLFTRFAAFASRITGSPYAFISAISLIIVWAATGPIFGFSDTWQIVINTATTIVTFLLVFVIQNSQNRDTCALQLKLDELIRATKGAHSVLLDLEELNEDELKELHERYETIAKEARKRIRQGKPDTDIIDVPAKKE